MIPQASTTPNAKTLTSAISRAVGLSDEYYGLDCATAADNCADVQDDMVNKGLDLDETSGQSLNRESIELRKKHQQEMKILEADMWKAIAEKDGESVEAICADAQRVPGKALRKK